MFQQAKKSMPAYIFRLFFNNTEIFLKLYFFDCFLFKEFKFFLKIDDR